MPGRVHHRAAYVAHRHFGRSRNGVDHHAGERALAKVAEQQARQELLLGNRRPREQCAQRRGAPCAHAGAAQSRDLRNASVDLDE